MQRWAAAPPHQITSPNFISLVIRRRCQFLSPERRDIREDACDVGGKDPTWEMRKLIFWGPQMTGPLATRAAPARRHVLAPESRLQALPPPTPQSYSLEPECDLLTCLLRPERRPLEMGQGSLSPRPGPCWQWVCHPHPTPQTAPPRKPAGPRWTHGEAKRAGTLAGEAGASPRGP